MSDQLGQFYTPDQLANLLHIEHDHLLTLVNNGHLRAYRIANEIRIAAPDLQAYLDTCRITTNGTTPPVTTPVTSDRKTCPTFGGQATFTYTGSVPTGTTIHPGTKATYKLHFNANQWQELLTAFQGKTIRAGLNFAKPEPGSMGAWIKEHWNTKMGPAAYIGGILNAEGYATRSKPGWITFHKTA
jgi:excisionase family DNA binding protein